MRLSEIAEFVVEEYPDCCMASNNVVSKGCREDWYEEYLIDELMDFFSFEIMNMCGCGCPEDTHEEKEEGVLFKFEAEKPAFDLFNLGNGRWKLETV